jgi:uncharacterized cupin superfamily protein
MGKIDIALVKVRRGTGYPAPYDQPCRERVREPLGDAAGLGQFGVNRLQLAPGTWSSQRHWHAAEDEFVYVLEGEVVLVTNSGEQVLRAGDAAGFAAGVADGHHLQNRSAEMAVVLEVGSRQPADDAVAYPDIDLELRRGEQQYVHKDGRRYLAPEKS